MKGWLVAACLAAVAGAAAQPARAQSELALFDKDVDYAARIDPALLADGAAFTRSLGGDVAMLANLVTLGSVGILAFDVLDARGWQNLGVDSSKGVWLSYSVATERNQLHHVRVIARLLPGSQAAFDNWLLRLLRLEASWTGKGPGLSELLGTGDKQSLAAIRRHKPILLGRRGKVRIVVRADKDRRIFDIVWPYGIQDWEWSDQGKAFFNALDLPKQSASLAAHDSVSLKAATTAPIGLWLRSGSLAKLDAASVIAPRQCEELDQASSIGPLNELGLAIDSSKRQTVSLVWRVTDVAGVARALELATDRVEAKVPSLGGSTMRASIGLSGTDGLRALARPVLFRTLGWPAIWRLARQCGDGHRHDLMAFHWLDLTGQWLDDIAATSEAAKTIVESFGPIEAEVDMLGTRTIPLPVINVRALVRQPGADLFARLLDNLFSNRRSVGDSVTAWGRGRIKPYRNRDVLGALIGDVPSTTLDSHESPSLMSFAPLVATIRVPELVAIVRSRFPAGISHSLQTLANRVRAASLVLSVADESVKLELTIP